MSNIAGIKYPGITTGASKVHINNMYIKYTFIFSDNLVGLLVFQILGAVALLVTISLAVEAFHARFGTRFVSLGFDNVFAILPSLLVLPSLATIFLEIDGLIDHQQRVLFLDFHLSSLEHHGHLSKDLAMPCML